jgi:hypothetical protein
MPQDLFRRKVITQINTAIREYQDAAGIGHPFLQGRIREIALDNLFKPLLPAGFEIGTGKVIDNSAYQSPEIDLVIYNRGVLPTIMYSEREGLFPTDACFYAIEVKSMVTADSIQDAIAKAEHLRQARYIPWAYEHDVGTPHPITPIIPAFFAFTTDLKRKSELKRYRENDPNFEADPRIRAICVVGKGYWWFRSYDNKWVFHSPTSDHDEVIDFLSGVINTIPGSFVKRSHSWLGAYLMLRQRGTVVE